MALGATATGLAVRAAQEAPAAAPWALLAIVATAAAFGLVPFVWDIPLMAKVQFPWRLLGLVEFAAITAIALAPPAGCSPPARSASGPPPRGRSRSSPSSGSRWGCPAPTRSPSGIGR